MVKMDDLRTRADLIAAFTQSGCAICRLVGEHERRQVDTLNYECVMDPDIRAHVRRSAGFCADHVQVWRANASKLATAQIYGDVLDRTAEELARVSFSRRRTADVMRSRARSIDVLVQERDCLICAASAETLRHLIKVLNRSFSDARLRDAFNRGFVCIPHGRYALAEAPDQIAFDIVRTRLVDVSAEIRSDLAEIVRKHDHRFTNEAPGAEVGAGDRAIRLVTGEGRDK